MESNLQSRELLERTSAIPWLVGSLVTLKMLDFDDESRPPVLCELISPLKN
jgi:hypothetical protein